LQLGRPEEPTMKRSIGLRVGLAAAALGLMGCQTADEQRLDDSRSAWNQMLRQQGAATYSYVVPWQSWTGYRSRTTLQFQNGSATYRRFEATPLLDDEMLGPIATQWEERGVELGRHTDSGAPLSTIDQLYQRCASEVLTRDPDDNGIYLELDARNILKTCVYTPRNCWDDCSFGVMIEDVEMGLRY
jgi:hypothetical protein